MATGETGKGLYRRPAPRGAIEYPKSWHFITIFDAGWLETPRGISRVTVRRDRRELFEKMHGEYLRCMPTAGVRAGSLGSSSVWPGGIPASALMPRGTRNVHIWCTIGV
jgi:hypothetical protein